MKGSNGESYRIEISSNLFDWERLEANCVTEDAIHFVDPEAPELGARFYRVMPVSDVELLDEE
jgi:hypothetical protein